MGVYVLLVIMHVGVMGKGNSNSMITQEFQSKDKCEKAREFFNNAVRATTKEIISKCVEK